MAQWNKNEQAYRVQDTTNFEVVMLADENGNPLNSYGAAANIPIAAGLLDGYSHINKFGYRTSFASTYQAIWDGTTAYPYIGTAGPATVTSDDTDDAGAVISVFGLDENYNDVSEDLTIGTPGAVNFIRIFRAFVKTPAAGETTNVGKISVTVDGAARAFISEEAGQTLMSVYTVPAGKTAYLMKLQCSVDKQKDCIFRFVVRPFGGAFNTKAQLGTFATPMNYDYPVPLKFTEKTDLEVQAISGNTMGGGATFDLILVDN
ncbi:hypothetical protein SRSM4_124 [Synechococcus phage S-RSM4]|uniref:Uncharacterized protein n=1 Tax=Synechococcus phage S-RSM4 TaxID=555387 RepID=C7BV92_9CAUD|nr:hypothetical protein SRSM4_124 [Synechococcus phage S-RSM4]CAR63321.1 hypothetical protein SRSM4_124 [Synechococcus phage S-RSM4]